MRIGRFNSILITITINNSRLAGYSGGAQEIAYLRYYTQKTKTK